MCIFAMFFMVLDLRLTKVGTRRSPFFCAHTSTDGNIYLVHLVTFSYLFCIFANPTVKDKTI